VIKAAGGFTVPPGKVLMGGPMMGLAQFTTDVPVVKGTSGIVVMTSDEVRHPDPKPCLRCGLCVRTCPMGLMPCDMAFVIQLDRLDEAEELDVMNCIECGCCSFACPSRRWLLQLFRYAKAQISARARQQKAG
jgi:electron transport complex protein RnfC